MLVQKRSQESESASKPAPAIRVLVKYGSAYHEICVNSQATFGELKKLLSGPTGLHPLDQKILYKDKERESTAYLDTAGVKDKSKLVVLEDLKAQAKRCLEMRRAAKSEQASKSISCP
ncbi:BAG family molecular chaperone regulator 1-like [Asparagus officinalis]|uniref:BAG family molecular chaperone regulator 1-like n=1 Tax=Asparagus officinalis TaxID=4686 RepID=UPI00098E3426|nr:BAG family molecular chaperone regulator 1-like [Asparagus officinalis]